MDWQATIEIWFLGHGLSHNLTKNAEDIDVTEREKWKKANYQLVSFLRHSIDPKFMVHFHTHKTCYDIWEKFWSVYSNDVQRVPHFD